MAISRVVITYDALYQNIHDDDDLTNDRVLLQTDNGIRCFYLDRGNNFTLNLLSFTSIELIIVSSTRGMMIPVSAKVKGTLTTN